MRILVPLPILIVILNLDVTLNDEISGNAADNKKFDFIKYRICEVYFSYIIFDLLIIILFLYISINIISIILVDLFHFFNKLKTLNIEYFNCMA